MIKKLCIISQYYPTVENPIYNFLDVLISQFADLGIECHVIVPTNEKTDKNKSESRVKKTLQDNKIYIHCPTTRIFRDRKIVGIPIKMFLINTFLRYICIVKTYKKVVKDADALYAHFWLASGIPAVKAGCKLGLPVFIATGEDVEEFLEDKKILNAYSGLFEKTLTGNIVVSTALKRGMFDNKMLPLSLKDKTRVFPNGVNLKEFYPYDKGEMRRRLGLSQEAFIICFIGYFIERKGYSRVLEIVRRREEITGLFIGGTIEDNQSVRIVNPGKVEHDKLPFYLSASDVFVLPTLSEGCCNAIIEAMACGLPIISADKSFNYDIVDSTCAILIDPTDNGAIEKAIMKLYNNLELREQMGKCAKEKAELFGIKERAQKILGFMNEMIRDNE